jgi:hypothetical protein
MGDEEESLERHEAHVEAVAQVVDSSPPKRMFNPLWQQQPTEEPEQLLLDKYLQSIDRRYHRLHDDDKEGSIHWTWNWLMTGAADPTNNNSNDPQDALCVLGLVELASDKLLKQHRLPVTTPVPRQIEKQPEFFSRVRQKQAKFLTLLAIQTRQHIHKTLSLIKRVPLVTLLGSRRTIQATLAVISFLAIFLKRASLNA